MMKGLDHRLSLNRSSRLEPQAPVVGGGLVKGVGNMSFDSRDTQKSEEKIVMSAHCSHCGGTCLLKVHVKDGVITRIGADSGEP